MEGTGRLTASYLEYVEVNLRIPQFPQYGETILMLVIPDSWYTYGIPILISTHVIQKDMWKVNEQNLNELNEAWRNMYVSTVTAGQLAPGKTAKSVFNLSMIRGLIITSKEVIPSPFEMQTVSAGQ